MYVRSAHYHTKFDRNLYINIPKQTTTKNIVFEVIQTWLDWLQNICVEYNKTSSPYHFAILYYHPIKEKNVIKND